MPSRKKAQGKARRAKQVNKASGSFRECALKFSGGCRHLGEENNWSQNDWDATNSLLDKYIKQYNVQAIENVPPGDKIRNIVEMANNIYHKYRQLDDKVNGARTLFRKLILAAGTEICTRAAKEKDLVKDDLIIGKRVFGFMIMIQVIEVRNTTEHTMNASILKLISSK